MHAPWLWTVFTIAAAGGQTLRNAMQRELIGALGAIGATQVRFLFGLPFAVVFLLLARLRDGGGVPAARADVRRSLDDFLARPRKSPPPR